MMFVMVYSTARFDATRRSGPWSSVLVERPADDQCSDFEAKFARKAVDSRSRLLSCGRRACMVAGGPAMEVDGTAGGSRHWCLTVSGLLAGLATLVLAGCGHVLPVTATFRG